MLRWLAEKLRERNASPLARWSVAIEEGSIVTSDGSDTTNKLAIPELRKVVVQTDDSGPWGADVLYFLFTGGTQPAAVFPLEAQGCQNFVEWLSTLPGYDDRELARAMGSTSVARFVVFEARS
jgi:hypothetical protein